MATPYIALTLLLANRPDEFAPYLNRTTEFNQLSKNKNKLFLLHRFPLRVFKSKSIKYLLEDY